MITWTRKSCPTRGLEIIYDMMPIHLHLEKTAISSYIRLEENLPKPWLNLKKKNIIPVSHLARIRETISKHEELREQTDAIEEIAKENEFFVNLESFEGGKKHRQHTQYNIYTDGSKQNGKAGAGYVIQKGSTIIQRGSFKLRDEATVFQGEICLLYTSPSPRDKRQSRMPSSA